ncbi:MAG: replicative DNA helicase [Chitinivibrionia bacterium]|nr:replicative DNA helicase [Chitinivibrionia bacterium]
MAETTKQQFDRLPPHSEEAEMAVIGAVLLDNQAFHQATESITYDTFYKKAHQDIFHAMTNLAGKSEAIDVITLSEELKRMGAYQAAGLPAYLTEIMDKVHTAANADFYAKIVLEKYILRQLISVSNAITTDCYMGEDEARQVLDRAESSIFEISEKGIRRGFIPIGDAIKHTFEKIERYREDRTLVSGVSTPFYELNSYTSGFQNADLVIIAGRPSMGKTSLALNIAQHLAIEKKIPVGVFSLEMSNDQLVMRLLCSEARVDFHRMRTGYMKDSEYAELAVVAQYLSEAPIFIDDSPSLTTLELRSKARRLKAERNIGCLMIDYLQLISVTARAENRQQQISIISGNLKRLAKELDIPVIALSQLSRAVEARGGEKRPMLSDLRESGSIEQDADVVLMLYRPEVYKGEDSDAAGTAEVIIAKQRNGPTGTVRLAFFKEYTRFENLAPASE